MNKNVMIAGAVVLVLGIGAVVFGLSSSDDDADTDASNDAVTSQSAASDAFPLDVSFTNLEPLSSGVYEGWIVRGDTKTSFGVFNIAEDGSIDGEFAADVDPQDGDTVAITIEPDNDPNPADPTAAVILAGEIANGSANLAFPVDISGFAGQYILATPTDDPAGNETAGVWFVDPSDITGTLDIPVAPDGWIYEGWVVHNGETPISTGKFKDPNAADDFSGYSGDAGGPALPGEDLIRNLPAGLEGPLAIDTGSSLIVLSIEPYVDGVDPTGDGPAQVKPLSATVPAGAADHVLFDLMQSSDSLPSGTASL